MRIFALGLFVFFSYSQSWADSCRFYLSTTQSPYFDPSVDTTENLVNYLNHLFTENIIGIDNLKQLKEELKADKTLSNPIPHKISNGHPVFTSLAYEIHYFNLAQYLMIDSLDKAALLQKLTIFIVQNENVEKERSGVKKKTEIIYRPMDFHQINPGKFRMGDDFDKTIIHTEILYPFEMMETPVTQFMWVDLMGSLPKNYAKFNDPNSETTIERNGKTFSLQIDHPVTMITWWSAAEFANRLSKLKGLPMVYDFSNVKFKPGTYAEDGTLAIETGKLKINAPDGDINRATGYRLPTWKEQEFVLSNRGQGDGRSFPWPGPREQYAHEQDLGWTTRNNGHSGYKHKVAQKMPFVIGNQNFYDLWGNVVEWSSDLTGASAICHGGDEIPYWSSHYKSTETNSAYRDYGFRLVRTLHDL